MPTRVSCQARVWLHIMTVLAKVHGVSGVQGVRRSGYLGFGV